MRTPCWRAPGHPTDNRLPAAVRERLLVPVLVLAVFMPVLSRPARAQQNTTPPAAAAQSPAEQNQNQDEEEQTAGENFPRSLRVDVDRAAARTLAELGPTPAGSDALTRLQLVVDDPAARFVEVAGENGLLRDAVLSAAEVQRELSAAGLQQLEALTGPAARQALHKAIDGADRAQALLQVVQRYGQTRAGLEAARRLAWLRFDRAQFVSAAATFRLALRHPQLSPEDRVLLVAARKLCLQRMRGASRRSGAVGQQPGEHSASGPRTAPATWHHAFHAADPVRKLTTAAINEAVRNGVVALPSAVPVLADVPLLPDKGHVVLCRTGPGLGGWNSQTGELLWHHAPASVAAGLNGDSRLLRNDGFQQLISRAEVFRALADDIHGRLTVSGGTVYAVWEASAEAATESTQPMQSLGLPTSGEAVDVLSAREIATGRELWQLTPANSPVLAAALPGVRLEADGVRLTGPPLVEGHEFFVCVEAGDSLVLLAGESRTGNLEWALPLGTVGRFNTETVRRTHAAAPVARAGELLICATARGSVAAVDLATRRIGWFRRYSRDDIQAADGLPRGRLNRHQTVRWWEGWRESILLCHGTVALVATPESDVLRAVETTTGRQLWQRARGEGLLAGPCIGETVLVTGRSSIAAVSIADGSLIWECPAGVPSGRPAVAGESLLLPLQSGEIVRINRQTGAVQRAVLSADTAVDRGGATPADGAATHRAGFGNLVAVPGGAIAVDAGGIERLADAATTRQALLAQLATAPASESLLVELAIHERQAGNFATAAKLLQQTVRETTNTGDLQELLRDTLTAELAAHPERLDAIYPQLVETAGGTDQLTLPEVRALAQTLSASGRNSAAALLWLEAASRFDDEPLPVAPGHFVRADRLLQAELCDLLAGLPSGEQAQVATAVREQLTAIRTSSEPFAWTRLAGQLELLPWSTESAAMAASPRSFGLGLMELELVLHGRIARYAQLARLAENLTADLTAGAETRKPALPWLLAVNANAAARPRGVAFSTGPAAARAAMELARLMDSHSLTTDAADAWRLLSGRFAGEPVDDAGQTGAQAVAALDTQSALAREIGQGPPAEWPSGKPKSEVIRQRQRNTDFKAVRIVPVAGSFAHRLRVLVNADGSRVRFQGDGQRGTWELKLPASDSPFRVAAPLHRGWGLGHLIVLRVGMDLFAIEPLDAQGESRARLVWHRQLYDGPPLRWDHLTLGIEVGRPGFRLPEVRVRDRYGREPGQVGPVGCSLLCLHSGASLIAVEPRSGKTLWKRDDLPSGCLSAGDELFVVLLTEHSRQARVLRAMDGAVLGSCMLPVAPEDMLRIEGRFGVFQQQRGDSRELVTVDLATGASQHVLPLASGETAFDAGTGRVGVFRQTGQTAVVQFHDVHSMPAGDGFLMEAGELAVVPLPAKLHNPAVPLHLAAWTDRHRVYLTVSGPFDRPENEQANRSRGDFRQIPVNGVLAAFDLPTGRLAWTSELNDAALRLEQPADAPLLLLDYWQIEPGKKTGARVDGILECLDSRTGETIYREQRPRRNSQLTVATYRDQGLVELNMPDRSIRLTWPAKP